MRNWIRLIYYPIATGVVISSCLIGYLDTVIPEKRRIEVPQKEYSDRKKSLGLILSFKLRETYGLNQTEIETTKTRITLPGEHRNIQLGSFVYEYKDESYIHPRICYMIKGITEGMCR